MQLFILFFCSLWRASTSLQLLCILPQFFYFQQQPSQQATTNLFKGKSPLERDTSWSITPVLLTLPSIIRPFLLVFYQLSHLTNMPYLVCSVNYAYNGKSQLAIVASKSHPGMIMLLQLQLAVMHLSQRTWNRCYYVQVAVEIFTAFEREGHL